METIRVNVNAVLCKGSLLEAASKKTYTAKNSVDSMLNRVDQKILNRSNLRSRLRTASQQLTEVRNQIDSIQRTTEAGACSYAAADRAADNDAQNINGRFR